MSQHDNLKELALKATPGPWFQWSDSVYAGTPIEITRSVLRGDTTEICEVSDSNESSEEDKAFIAAANPAAILELIAQRDELLAALIYHQEQTRPIQRTIDAIAKAVQS